MINKRQIQYEYGISTVDGCVLHISEIDEPGKACLCVCPSCGRAMEAKLGKGIEKGGRTPHFAHSKDNNTLTCSAKHANESALHKLAKQIFKENNHILLPKYCLRGKDDETCNKNDPRQLADFCCADEFLFYYQDISVEKRMQDFVTDIVLSSGKNMLCVEIAVKHFVDSKKLKAIQTNNISCIEIDISRFYNKDTQFNRGELEQALINQANKKYWLFNRRKEEYLIKLKERNKNLEEEYQITIKKEKEKQKKILQKQKKLNEWIEQQDLLREQIDIRIRNIKADNIAYKTLVEGLRNNEEAKAFFVQTTFFNEALKTQDGIPFFCNIPVFGEIAFLCDRRVWQMMIFENFFYKRKSGVVAWKNIYCFFYNHHKNLLSEEWVYKWHKDIKYYKFNDLLGQAIEEYLVHLSGLGFISQLIYDEGVDDLHEYWFKKHTIIPPNKEYGRLLEKALKEYIIEANPFQNLQNKMFPKRES